VAAVADPFGGSWYVEELTDALERRATELIAEIDERGGAVAAVESGWMKDAIEDVAFATQRAIERGDEVIVGVNRYVAEEEPEIEIHRLDPTLEARQVQRLAALRAERDGAAVERGLAGVRAAAEDESANLLVPMREALAARATVGEVCGELRTAWGTYDALLGQR
jgi:methylmalonyl-CoA mutase N-terminal domain/subunit